MALLTPGPRVGISVCPSVQALIGPLSAGGTEADRAPLPLATERFLLVDSARGPHGPEPPSCDTPAPHGDVGGLYGGSGPKRLQCAPSAVAHSSASRIQPRSGSPPLPIGSGLVHLELIRYAVAIIPGTPKSPCVNL